MTDLLVRLFIKKANEPQEPKVRISYGKLAGMVGIVCNLLLAMAKLMVGVFVGSLAVMADAVNNLSDMLSSVITLVGFKMSEKPADEEHPFGHARFEYVAALTVAVAVMAVGIELGIGSVEKILSPTPVYYSIGSLLVLAIAVAVKLWMAVFNRKIGRRIGSTALQAAFTDSRNDAIATAALLAAAVVSRFTRWELDGWMGAGVAIFILISGVGLVRDTLDPLLGTAPTPELVQKIDQKISSYPGVLGTHDLIVHDYGPGRRFASAHVEMASEADVLQSHDTIDNIERDFLEQEGIHLIIHYDPVQTTSEEVGSARSEVAQVVAHIDPDLKIHDFRLVDGPTHTNYIFDIVVPMKYETSDAQLRRSIENALQKNKEKPVHVVLTVDRSYAPIPKQSTKK